jgi:hypothetical protein
VEPLGECEGVVLAREDDDAAVRVEEIRLRSR